MAVATVQPLAHARGSFGKNPGTLRGTLGNTFRTNLRQQCSRVFSRTLTRVVRLECP